MTLNVSGEFGSEPRRFVQPDFQVSAWSSAGSSISVLQKAVDVLFFSSSFLEQTHTHTSIEVFGNQRYLSSNTTHNPLLCRIVDSATYRFVHQLNQPKSL
jgi:hypothetical protein